MAQLQSSSVTGSLIVSGALEVLGAFSGSIVNALTASYVNPLEQDVEITGSLSVLEGTTVLRPNITDVSATNALEVKNSSGTTVILLRNNGTSVFNDSIKVPYFSSPNGKILFGSTSVAIGGSYVTNPQARLQVRGSGTNSSTIAFRVENANASSSLVVNDYGNVAIGGTPSPNTSRNLLITGPTGASLNIETNNPRIDLNDIGGGGDNNPARIASYNGNVALAADIDSTGTRPEVSLSVRGTEIGNFTETGLGIFNSAPSYALDVSGSGNFTNGLTVTGSLITDGDLTVTGTVTAQEFKTEFVSASIVYRSGSTKFGDTDDDVHQFTGSLDLSGSLTVTGPTSQAITVIDENQSAYYTQLRPTGIDFGRSTSYLKPITDSTQVLVIGGVSTKWSRVQSYAKQYYTWDIDGNEKLKLSTLSLDASTNITTTGEIRIGSPTSAERLFRLNSSTIGNAIAFGTTSGVFTMGVLGKSVGFGTTSPLYKLHIVDSGDHAGLSGSLNVNNVLYVSGSNVGIGTTTPAYPLEVAGNLGLQGDTIYMRTDIGGSHILKIGAPTIAGSTSMSRRLEISTNTAGVTLQGIGNITEDLTLRGNDSVRLQTSAGIALYAGPTGNIGIGTTSPTEKLHVTGSVKIEGGTLLLNNGDNSVYIGDNSGLNDDKTNNYNVGIGPGALADVTSGTSNIAIGRNALADLTTGDANVVVGPYAAALLTTTDGTTAIGAGSQQFTTSGVRSTSLGYRSLHFNETGDDNVVIGYNAQYTSSVSDVVVIGYGAAYSSISTGAVAIGFEALQNSTGNYPVAIGWSAMANNTGTSQPIGIGYNAMRFNSGNGVVGIGSTALQFNSGDANTALGRGAGYNAVYQTGSFNTFLGYNSTYSSSAPNISNATAVGANVTLTNSNTVILGNNAKVGIGTTSPSEALTVEGNISASGELYLNRKIYTTRDAANATYIDLNEDSFKFYANNQEKVSFDISETVFNPEGGGTTDFRIAGDTNSSLFFANVGTEKVGIGTVTPAEKLTVEGNISGSGNLTVAGAIEGASKSFNIPHPTQPGKKLIYGSLEGPEHGVYARGKVEGNVIQLPEEWTGLVDEDTITVQLTSIGSHQNLYVSDIRDNKVFIKNGNTFSSKIKAFYFIQAMRKDIDKLQTVR